MGTALSMTQHFEGPYNLDAQGRESRDRCVWRTVEAKCPALEAHHTAPPSTVTVRLAVQSRLLNPPEPLDFAVVLLGRWHSERAYLRRLGHQERASTAAGLALKACRRLRVPK
ncbi:uncharacterized protein LOC142775282 [Rhipicephalus microplus]|uniref:uncharacterized protein LOC142775282 n=1 Tax=Rhipicephalus microplus TaxID=6941 RepID=UPI003F6B9471